MRICTTLFLAFLFFVSPASIMAQTLTGMVVDATNGQPVANVSYENIFTHVSGITDSTGRIAIGVSGGQLVEFRKLGYKIARVRVPSGMLPSFFKIQMQQGAMELQEVEVHDRYRNYRNDSLRNYELYKQEINYQKMSGVQMIQHPFTALSRHYQQIMRFQKEYKYLEEQRYVDYAFNEKTITMLTGLKGDSLQRYIRQFRPSYEQLRNMPEYYFFSYIKQTVNVWRRQQQYSGSRGSY